jgi:hypothetical protein
MLNQYSNFWFDGKNSSLVDNFLGIDKEKKGKDLIALAGYRRAISNFVNIVTGKSIPVKFNMKNASYTDGKTITIGANISDKNFDIAVGLALHEASHNLLSSFGILKGLESNIPISIMAHAEEKGYSDSEITSHIKSLMNWVEDRRIDHFIFTTSPGYKGYYHSMYDKYFYSKVVDKALKSKKYRSEIWESYEFRIINIHNKNRQLNALNGLKDIWNAIDLKNINRLKSTENSFDIACDIYMIVLNNIKDATQTIDNETGEVTYTPSEGNEKSEGSGDSEGTAVDTDEGTLETDGKDVNDDGSELSELSDTQEKSLDKAIKKQADFLDGVIKKTLMSKKDANQLNAIEESGASYEEVGDEELTYGKTKSLVVRNLTKNLIDSDTFYAADSQNGRNYDRNEDLNFVEEGFRLGTVLGKKLKIRTEETTTKYTRKETGRIDKRLIAELGFGNTNIFSQSFVDKYNKAYLHLSIDASGSMHGSRWNKAMTSAVAMIKAADMAGNIDVVVTIRSTHSSSDRYHSGSDYYPLIMVVYDSRKDKLSKVKSLFKYLNTSGTTPEGLTFEAIMKDLMPGNGSTDSYFVNYSDGCPMFSNKDMYYHSSNAYKHTRKQVERMKNLGIKVLSYFISDSYKCESDNKAFISMYGKDAQFINATNMMEVARSMNKKFLER